MGQLVYGLEQLAYGSEKFVCIDFVLTGTLLLYMYCQREFALGRDTEQGPVSWPPRKS
jgi:hypothetical protein